MAFIRPGTNFFFVSQTAVSRSRKAAMMGVLGIASGVMVWAGISLLRLVFDYQKNGLAAYADSMVGGGLYLFGWVTRCYVVH
ncbi:LysE family transporter [Shigella flexneri]